MKNDYNNQTKKTGTSEAKVSPKRVNETETEENNRAIERDTNVERDKLQQ